jgi:glycine/D-amino acid oxidase-like deaminating enzyme
MIPTFRSSAHWLADLPAHPARAPLAGAQRADIAIVGGGFVGLWTAYHLKTLDPSLDIAVIEQGHCGGGASGLNGGFLMSWWPKIASLLRQCGQDDALWLADQSTAAVRDLAPFLASHGLDADQVLAGWLWTATTPLHLGAWNAVLETTRRLGRPEIFQELPTAEIGLRCGSPLHIAGICEPVNGTVHPGKLGRGLAGVVAGLGVRIYEESGVQQISRSRPARLTTPQGFLEADRVVVATNAWAASVPELARSFVCVTSSVIATPPIPERLAEIGWTGGESITDSQSTVTYYRTTRDGRIVFGKGGGRLSYTGAPAAWVFDHRAGIAAALADFRRVYPALADVPIERSWSGPIDRTRDSLPLIGTLPGASHIAYGIGWSGNGVGPSRLGGRMLAGLALERSERWTENRFVNRPLDRFPPEPLRFLGGSLVLAAMARKDRAEIAGRRPRWIDRSLARLAPAGLEDK